MATKKKAVGIPAIDKGLPKVVVEPKTEPAKSDGFQTGKPKIVSIGKISQHSAVLRIKDKAGNIYKGVYQEFITNVNAPNCKAKKGDAVWISETGHTIKNVVGFQSNH